MKNDKDNKEEIKQLVIARLDSIPPDVSISVGSEGKFNKWELITQIENDTEIGKKMVKLELEYLRNLKEGNYYAGFISDN